MKKNQFVVAFGYPNRILLLTLILIVPFSAALSTINAHINQHNPVDNDLNEDNKMNTSPVSVESEDDVIDDTDETEEESAGPRPCTCGIFLSKQFTKGSKDQPNGEPVIMQEMDNHFVHNSIGARQCVNKCIEMIIKHLAKSAEIICATIDHDCVKEKAYLFTRNYDDLWSNTNMSAGREFCCKDNLPYKC